MRKIEGWHHEARDKHSCFEAINQVLDKERTPEVRVLRMRERRAVLSRSYVVFYRLPHCTEAGEKGGGILIKSLLDYSLVKVSKQLC